jgi:F0F1-type ATP synthase assembly protein I
MPGSEKRTALNAARIEVITWALIFGGLTGASLGLFVDRQPGGAILGGVFIVGGLIAIALGIVLIIVRSRMADTPARKAKP